MSIRAVASLTIALLSSLSLSTSALADIDAATAKAAAKKIVETKVQPFLNGLKSLKDDLEAANKTRKKWAPYTEDWKKWGPAEAEANKDSFTWCEYMWRVRKSRAFRRTHMVSKTATALKKFQQESGGAVMEFFITGAKGGNVVQSQITSDWFQGDEAKFKEVAGKKSLYFGDLERDDTVGMMGLQVSIPLWDGDTFLGVAVVLIIPEKVK